MNRFFPWRLVVFVLAIGGCIRLIDPEAELDSLVSAERAFSKTSVSKGIREAFLTYLAGDAIVFRPHPVEGRKWYQERPATPALLTWEPAFAEISRAGDLGYTTGPWEFKPDSAKDGPSTYGHYVSVWKKQPDGAWRVVIDVGIVHPKPETPAAGPTFPAMTKRKAAPSVDVEAERAALLNVDRAFAKASASQGAVVAFTSFVADDARFYRMNTFPLIGKEKARSALSEKPGLLTWQPIAADLSRAGDLGYTYGSAEFKPTANDNGAVESSCYLRIWRKDTNGAWKVVLDLDSPIPPAE
jgi:ketosteroid isomerase-like protein